MTERNWEIQNINPNLIKITGNITFHTAARAKAYGQKAIDNIANAKVDLSELDEVDSSCLSFLLSLLRYANSKHKVIEFINVPHKLLDLSRVSGIDEILPVA